MSLSPGGQSRSVFRPARRIGAAFPAGGERLGVGESLQQRQGALQIQLRCGQRLDLNGLLLHQPAGGRQCRCPVGFGGKQVEQVAIHRLPHRKGLQHP